MSARGGARSSSRYVLIGAHLAETEIPGVTWFEAAPIVLSAVEFDPARGTADPELVRRALEARKALLDQETFIAIRYGVSISGADEARTKCAPHLERWRQILEKRQGMVEITLRIAGKDRAVRPDRAAFRSGADYLRALHQARAPQIAEETKRQIEQAFGDVAVEYRWSHREDGGSEFVALVRRSELDSAREAGARLQSTLSAVPFLLSGPWPLEVFSDEAG